MSKPDLSEFYRYSKPRKAPCKVGVALVQLKDAEKAQLEAALATDPGYITAGAIERWAKHRKLVVTAASVITHRKGSCSCDDD